MTVVYQTVEEEQVAPADIFREPVVGVNRYYVQL